MFLESSDPQIFDPSPHIDRARMHQAIREHFHRHNFLEVDAPILCAEPIPEAHIHLFHTQRTHPDFEGIKLHLLPSPEAWLKRLLAAGAPSLFHIGKSFRNGEQLDQWHRLEFTMLEWYKLDVDSQANIHEMQNLLASCTQALGQNAKELCRPIRCFTMEEAFQEFAGFSLESDLLEAGLGEEHEQHKARRRASSILQTRLKERSLPFEKSENADDCFHRLFLTLVEDELPKDRPLALTHWPRLVPTLAKSLNGTPWSDRWELYIKGVEVANCYGEETNPSALREYWDAEAALMPTPHPQSNWPETVGGNLPECSGVAVGLDRLLALLRGDQGLGGLDLFPINDMIPR